MGSSCELLSCVDAHIAYLHSCKVSSRTKRGISTRGTPALATWASEKARCGAREHVRFLVNAQCVGVPAVPPCYSLYRQLSHTASRSALHAPLCSDNVYDVRRPTYDAWCIRAAETLTR